MAAFENFDDATLRAICNALGDTSTGLTGSEIGQLLSASGSVGTELAMKSRKETTLKRQGQGDDGTKERPIAGDNRRRTRMA